MKNNTQSKFVPIVTESSSDRFTHETNDCVVQAISNALKMPYKDAHAFCKLAGRKDRKGVPTYSVINMLTDKYKDELRDKYGIEKIDPSFISKFNNNPPTVNQFLKEHRDEGNYIIVTRGHAQSLVDGIAYNVYHKCSRVRFYFKIHYMAKTKPAAKMTANEIRSVAATKGLKVIGVTTDELLKNVFIPEIGEKVMLVKRKADPMLTVTYLGHFKCKKTNVYYAKLKDAQGKRYIKQLVKLVKIETNETN